MADFLPDIDNCIAVLNRGGVILYPTDTVWGLGCDATSSAAVEKIYRIKQRPGHKSLVVLMTEEREVLKYVTAPDLSLFDYLNTVTRPTTVIYQGVIGLADNVVGTDGSAAIRIVQDPFCRHLIKRFRKPIVSTSANISGQASPGTFRDITDTIKTEVDYVVQHRQDDSTPSTPSAIITWNPNGTITFIRK